MCVEIELVGGAADGRRLAVCNPMNPPSSLRVPAPAPLRSITGTAQAPDDIPALTVLLYVRDELPSSSDSGPHWYYRLQQAIPE
ncbi:hypothetical protein AB0G49_13725 [Streptomyces longwoodensis]|uniref:hypothetical protein n=1 Tax=Streptomyces longwoodensis TaxID=68231 RepID=UPI0033ED1EE8